MVIGGCHCSPQSIVRNMFRFSYVLLITSKYTYVVRIHCLETTHSTPLLYLINLTQCRTECTEYAVRLLSMGDRTHHTYDSVRILATGYHPRLNRMTEAHDIMRNMHPFHYHKHISVQYKSWSSVSCISSTTGRKTRSIDRHSSPQEYVQNISPILLAHQNQQTSSVEVLSRVQWPWVPGTEWAYGKHGSSRSMRPARGL